MKSIKVDIGLSFDAPHSQNWLDQDDGVLVIGFEPNPIWVKWITSPEEKRDRTFKDYHTLTKQIQHEYVGKRFFVIPVALCDVESPSQMTLYIPNASDGCGSLLKDKQLGGTRESFNVQVFSLSDFFDLLPLDSVIDYLKIDVQGLDINVLKSAKNYLSDRVVYVTAEPEVHQYHGAENNTPASIIEYMTSIGFIYLNHPNTRDPTFLNKKFEVSDKKETYIWQHY